MVPLRPFAPSQRPGTFARRGGVAGPPVLPL